MSLIRLSHRSLVTPLCSRFFHVQSFCLSSGAADSNDFKKKESSHELEYAKKQERAALRTMLLRMENDADPGDKKAISSLQQIFTNNGLKLSNKIQSDLLQWRHSSH
jgi:hypothetical protein